MLTIIAGVFILLLAVAGLATGILLGRPPLEGSCGGGGCGGACDTCTLRLEGKRE